METFTRHTFDELMSQSGALNVSIYMPTFCQKETVQNRIRLKNLAAEAERRLLADGCDGGQARKFVERIQALAEDEAFWRDSSEGLALFATSEVLRAFRLPIAFHECVVVAPNFQLAPLLPLLHGSGELLILAVSKNQVRLLEGDRFHVRPVTLKNMPASLAEGLSLEQPQAMMQFHGGVSHGKAGRETVFHGQGGASDHEKSEVLEYFHQIDHALCEYLGARQTPLVFAGVDYLFPLYCRANHYGYLQLEHISGNPELRSDRELHRAAWKIVAPRLDQLADDALQHVLHFSGTTRFVTDFDEIVQAAHEGIVETLLVARDAEQWGRFDEDTGNVERLTEPKPHSIDLVNLAALQTMAHHGKVFEVDAGRLPGQASLIALLRYPQAAEAPANS